MVLPGSAAFTHLTVAAVRGWWLPPTVPSPVFVAVPLGHRYPERAGVRVARLTTAPAVQRVAGLPLVSAADTLLALARDVAAFTGHGYRLSTLRALDLFPMTHHVECVALFRAA